MYNFPGSGSYHNTTSGAIMGGGRFMIIVYTVQAAYSFETIFIHEINIVMNIMLCLSTKNILNGLLQLLLCYIII